MINFLYKILLFAAFCLFFLLITWFGLSLYIKMKSDFVIDKKVENIILGHSHAEFAYNDSLITNVRNFANSAEPYFYTYIKLKQLVKNNPEIERVFLEFSNNSLVSWMDEWVWDSRYVKHRFDFYGPFLEPKQFWTLFKNNPGTTIENFIESIIENLWRILRGETEYVDYIGQYSPLEFTMQLKPEDREILEQETSQKISGVNKVYLDKIIELCAENDIELLFIRTPQHPYCHELSNELLFQKFYAENYSSIEFLDFHLFPLENHEYADPEHLNYRGANKLSNWLNELIKGGLFEVSDQSAFVREKISEERKLNNK